MPKKYSYPFSPQKLAARMKPAQQALILRLTNKPAAVGAGMVQAERLAVPTVLRKPLVLKTPAPGDCLYSLTEAGLRVQAVLRAAL